MKALIVLHTGFKIWKILIREYSRIKICFSWGRFVHMMHLDQLQESKNVSVMDCKLGF